MEMNLASPNSPSSSTIRKRSMISKDCAPVGWAMLMDELVAT
jgi:hypothetical protein